MNVPMPKQLKADLQRLVAGGRYASLSEALRDGARKVINGQRITVNGFTEEFELETLEAEQEPIDWSTAWKSKKDIEEGLTKILEKHRSKNKK